MVEGCAKRIDIYTWVKALSTTTIVHLRRCVTMANTSRCGGCLLTLIVVVFREAKINQYSPIILAAHHDIAWLDIEVGSLSIMQIAQCRGHILDIAHSSTLSKSAIAADYIANGLTLDILHNVVGRIVLLEYIVYGNDMGMVERRQGTSLLDELLLISTHHIGATLRAKRYAIGVSIAVVVLRGEILLDTHFAPRHSLLGEVGDAKASLTNSLNNTIATTLQQSASTKLYAILLNSDIDNSLLLFIHNIGLREYSIKNRRFGQWSYISRMHKTHSYTKITNY